LIIETQTYKRKDIKGMGNNKFELVRVVEENNKPVKQGVTKIAKDENGLIMTQAISLNLDTGKMEERVRLTAQSFHRALVENITSSNIEVINAIVQAMLDDALAQADKNTKEYLTNIIGDINNRVAEHKQNNINTMKDYGVGKPKPVKSNAWDEEIDIYNMGTPVVSSMGGEQNVEIESSEEEEYSGVMDF